VDFCEAAELVGSVVELLQSEHAFEGISLALLSEKVLIDQY